MRRVSEVIDCWYDSGAMPFAQWGYGGEESAGEQNNRRAARFKSSSFRLSSSARRSIRREDGFTRNSPSARCCGDTATTTTRSMQQEFPHPFRNCIVLGLMLGEDGQKMSKSKRNYREPREIFDKYGADAMRWYLLANQPPWTSIRYSEQAIKESVPEFSASTLERIQFLSRSTQTSTSFDPAAAGAGECNRPVWRRGASAAFCSGANSIAGF